MISSNRQKMAAMPSAPKARSASGLRDTQEEARAFAKKLNPADHPDVEHVRNTKGGRRDKWRSNK